MLSKPALRKLKRTFHTHDEPPLTPAKPHFVNTNSTRTRADSIGEIFTVLIPLVYAVLCPWTRMEERWTLYAVHDIVHLGVAKDALVNYDHLIYTDWQPVPRSFVGPLLLAIPTKVFLAIAHFVGLRFLVVEQLIVRMVISIVNSVCLIMLSRRAGLHFGLDTSRRLVILLCVQFHLAFWMSRTIPNMLVFGPTQLAMAWTFFPSNNFSSTYADTRRAVVLLTVCTLIFRLELIGLAGALGLYMLWHRRIPLTDAIKIASVTAILSIGLTVVVDSYFWRTWMWPEATQFVWNVLGRNSEQYGVSPWYAYIAAHLPKLMGLAWPLMLYSCYRSTESRSMFMPLLAHVCVMSCLKHKEWRFCVYVLPMLNILGLQGLATIRKRSVLLARSMFAAMCITSVAFTILSLFVSSSNYPGAFAVNRINEILRNNKTELGSAYVPSTVYVDWYPAITGQLTSHFDPALALYTKNQIAFGVDEFVYPERFEYVVTQQPEEFTRNGYAVIDSITAWGGLKVQKHFYKPLMKIHRSRSEVVADPLSFLLRILPVRPTWKEMVWIMQWEKAHYAAVKG